MTESDDMEAEPLTEIPEQTAYLEDNDGEHCISFADLKWEDGNEYIKIPEPLADLDYLNIKEGETELYNNDDGYISIGSWTGKGIQKIHIEEDEDGYWLKVTDELEAIKPLTNSMVLVLNCGELWVLNYNTFWEKLAVGLHGVPQNGDSAG